MRFHFDERKSGRLRANPKRGVGFEEAQEIFSHPYYLDQRSDLPEQYRAIGWVGEQFKAVVQVCARSLARLKCAGTSG
jgi:uncharacterized DUF497 family protein